MTKEEKECRKALHDSVWGLLFEYADLRDELSGVLLSFELLYVDIQDHMEGIQCEMDSLKEHLEACSRKLQGFHVQDGSWNPFDAIGQGRQAGNTEAEIPNVSGSMELSDGFGGELPFN